MPRVWATPYNGASPTPEVRGPLRAHTYSAGPVSDWSTMRSILVRGLMRIMRFAIAAPMAMTTACGSGTAEVEPPADQGPEFVGVEWMQVDNNPVLEQPVCPGWNCLGMTDPSIGAGATDGLVMWMSAGGDAAAGGPVIGRATSTGDLSFTHDPNVPVMLPQDGVWDKWRETVTGLYDGQAGRWRMWYLGYAISFFDDPGIGQALSDDAAGSSWSRPASPIYRPAPGAWDANFITGPTVVRGPDGVWRLYYVGAGTTVGVGLLTSVDGESWTPHPDNPVFERELNGWDQGLLDPAVLYVDGRYLMWYGGFEEPLDLSSTPISIGLATSADGITWTRYGNGPVIRPGPAGSWNDLRVASPSVHRLANGSLLLALHGQSLSDAATGSSLGRIGIYQSRVPPG
jgi:hypothetical protein